MEKNDIITTRWEGKNTYSIKRSFEMKKKHIDKYIQNEMKKKQIDRKTITKE